MPNIFLNYRREDTKSEARLLYQSLIEDFPRGEVIMDVDTIPPAANFKEYLGRAVEECDFFLALIGPKWLETGALNDSRDWVRIEIEAALAKRKTILPILVNDGRIPDPDDLPDSVREIAFRNALTLDTGRDFDLHVSRIKGWIRRIGVGDDARQEAEETDRRASEATGPSSENSISDFLRRFLSPIIFATCGFLYVSLVSIGTNDNATGLGCSVRSYSGFDRGHYL
jgi:hypothetical protein